MATIQLQAPLPQSSCRTDWATWTFKTDDNEKIEEKLEYFGRLGDHLLPTGKWSEAHAGRHFTHVIEHDSGMTIEFTPQHTNKRNAGLTAVSLPGQIWGALDAIERLVVIADVGQLAGYYRCTRWDAQITTIEPPMSIEEFVRRAEEKSIWAVRYGQGQPYGKKNLHNEWVEPPSYYFGAKGSAAMARVYDHGVKWQWPIPSMRLELQLRKQWASDHFERLRRTADHELSVEAGDLRAEELCVKSALKQHLKLKDTSKWTGKRLPKNWASQAPDLPWYEELVDTTYDSLKATHRPVTTWERSKTVCAEQYGRKVTKQLLLDACTQGTSFSDQALIFAAQMASQLVPEDLLELKAVIPEEQWDTLRDNFHTLTGDVADLVDEIAIEKGAKPPRG